MAVETTHKSVGATGRQYPTMQTWSDDSPATLATAERWDAGTFTGSFIIGEQVTGVGLTNGKIVDTDNATYVTFAVITGNTNTLVTLTGTTSGKSCVVSTKTFTGVIWQGEMYGDSEFSSASNQLAIAGITATSTCYMHLTAAVGQSYRDQAGVRAHTADYYTAAGVVAIKCTVGYIRPITTAAAFTKFSRLQVHVSAGGGQAFSAIKCTVGPLILENCLIRETTTNSGGENTLYLPTSSTGNTLRNVILIIDSPKATAMNGDYCTSHNFHASTFIRTSNNTVTGQVINLGGGGTTHSMTSCNVFGFTALKTGGASFASGGNNASDFASGFPGSNNVYSVTYSGTRPFVQASNSATDIRVTAASDAGPNLAGAGSLDAVNAPNDWSNYPRAANPTIGAWEITAAAAAVAAVTNRFYRPFPFSPGSPNL